MTDENQQPVLSQEQIDSVIALYSNRQYQDAIDEILVLDESYPNVPFLFNLIGACHKQLGQLELSAKMFEKAVDIKPDYAEAHKNLGITLKDLGQLEAAVKSLKDAIEVIPNYVDAHYNLAITFKDLEQLDNAVQSYNRAIEINPNFAQAHNNLGNVFKDLEQSKDAIKSFEKAIEINPAFAHAHNNLGNVYKDLDQLDDAIKSYENAIELNPNFAEAHNNLGSVLKDLEQLDNAIKSYEKAIRLNPNFAEAYNNLGNVFKDLRLLDDAVKNYEKAINIRPKYAQAYNNLGFALMGLARLDEAVACFESAISIKPDYVEAHNYLGNVLDILGKVQAGAKCIEKAIAIDPDFAEAHYSLGNMFRNLKQREKAHLCYERAIAIKPDMAFLFGSLLNNKMNLGIWDDFSNQLEELRSRINNNENVIGPFSLLGLIDDPALQRKASEIFTNYHYPQNHTLSKIDLYPKHKKIRISYFSGDFKIHPVAYLTAELYEVHDRNHFEIHAFSLGPDTKDKLNLRIKAGVDHFHNVQVMSNKEIALLARSLEIDIAVDLGGFSGNSRTKIFAMSAAPIQLSYIGFLGTMSADYYDYLIADPVMIPKENQKYFVEKIVYLPSFQVNDSTDLPPEITLTRKDVGLPEEGFVFCCFNNTYKFTPTTFDSWARILKSVDGSLLLIYIDNKSAEINLTKEIVQRDVEAERLIFCERLKRQDYLARYRTANLFLDTHPYNAGTTASDALKMGLPILTLKGNSFNSREAASILTSINLPELITNTPEEYEALAIELATSPDKLKAIKDKLADNLSTAPLFDTKLFTKHLESAYTEMYERHHKGLEPDHIYVEV